MNTTYNPDFDPTGIEGGVDTGALPWLPVPGFAGLAMKPLRASLETGAFSAVLRIGAGAALEHLVPLGAADFIGLSGRATFEGGPTAGSICPGVWGYVPANTRLARLRAAETTEILANFHGPLARLGRDGRSVAALLTSHDVRLAARSRGLTLVPDTLAECMQPRPAASAEPLEVGSAGGSPASAPAERLGAGAAPAASPHLVDTTQLPWCPTPGVPDIELKILRVSEETGTTSLLVRHGGVAAPHYHLGPADFMVLSGRIGYRAGPPEGYGPGTWFFEPAGARHDATQRLGPDELVYTANVYGPIQFDSGRGTPIVAVLSWMQYLEIARAAGATLVPGKSLDDRSLLAWTPIGTG